MHELVEIDPDVTVIWRSFELRPEPVPTLEPGGAYLERAWRTSVNPLAQQLGITMKLPPVQPRSRMAHAAAHWARSQGHFDVYHAALLRAFFEDGADIGDPVVLVTIADTLGLPGKELQAALSQHVFEPAVLDDEQVAAMLGLNGVPAFVANRRVALSGVQPIENLKQLVAYTRSLPDEDAEP